MVRKASIIKIKLNKCCLIYIFIYFHAFNVAFAFCYFFDPALEHGLESYVW